MRAWNEFKSASQRRHEWVEQGKKRAEERSLEWLRDALKNAKLMDDSEEVKILGLAVHFREKLDRGERIDIV